jgi:ribose/xylose/arabinose/galactoside ABC-type transport system permease subunit
VVQVQVQAKDPTATQAVSPAMSGETGEGSGLARLRKWLLSPDLALPLLVLALFVATAILEPSFLQVSNLQNILRQMAVLTVLASAAAITIISGGLDLSIGAVAALSGVVAATVMVEHGVLLGVLAGLACGAVVGLLNGGLIARFDVSPFIVTLGMLSVASGTAFTVTGGLPVYGLPASFTDPLGYQKVLGLPISFLLAFATLLLVGALLAYTRFGKYLYALGGNRTATTYAGVPVRRYITAAYVASGTLAGLAGLLLTGRVAAAQPTAGTGLELQAIAAVIIGGIALTGGSGRARHAFYGVALLTLLSNSMNLLSVSSNAQLLVTGLTVIVAVVADRIRRR